MALQVRGPLQSFGGQIAEALGTGLGSGLQSLANMKLSQMQQRQRAVGALPILKELVGEEKAPLYAQFAATDPKGFSQVLKGMIEQPAKERKEQLQINRLHTPLIKEIKDHATRSDDLEKEVDVTIDMIKNPKGKLAIGPLVGHLPIVNSATRNLERQIKNLVIKLAAKDSLPGQRSKYFLELVEAGKPSRLLAEEDLLEALYKIKGGTREDRKRKESLKSILEENNGKIPEDLEYRLLQGEEASGATAELKKENEIMEQVISANNIKGPQDIKAKAKEIHKVYKRLPSPAGYKEGQVGQEGPYEFVKRDGDWVYLGRVA